MANSNLEKLADQTIRLAEVTLRLKDRAEELEGKVATLEFENYKLSQRVKRLEERFNERFPSDEILDGLKQTIRP